MNTMFIKWTTFIIKLRRSKNNSLIYNTNVKHIATSVKDSPPLNSQLKCSVIKECSAIYLDVCLFTDRLVIALLCSLTN